MFIYTQARQKLQQYMRAMRLISYITTCYTVIQTSCHHKRHGHVSVSKGDEVFMNKLAQFVHSFIALAHYSAD